jgi:DNA-binding transcriptional MerR regulator
MGAVGSSTLQEKEAYRIGEVASLTQIEPHVLRYWETEFPALRPTKTAHGQRLYRQADVETVLTIKRLLYEEGFTIAGARKRFESGNGGSVHSMPQAEPVTPPAASAKERITRDQLLAVRAELVRLLTLLSRR